MLSIKKIFVFRQISLTSERLDSLLNCVVWDESSRLTDKPIAESVFMNQFQQNYWIEWHLDFL